ncbi:hypothetical protein, partial [Mycobacterium tuberculosis]
GDLDFYLGISVTRTSSGSLFLSQRQYIQDLFHRSGMESCKGVATPKSSAVVFPSSGVSFSDPTRYRRVVGGL